MKYLLDTDICIHLIRRKPLPLLHKLTAQPLGEVGVSAITVAELQYGVRRSQLPKQNEQALEMFLLPLVIADFDYDATLAYGRVRADLEAGGQPIGPLDTLIAAHALSLAAILVTNNLREFGRVAGLRIENWLT